MPRLSTCRYMVASDEEILYTDDTIRIIYMKTYTFHLKEAHVMVLETDIRRMSCYGVLQAGISHESHLNPHMRLVLYLIYKERHNAVHAHQLVADFNDEFHYEIPFSAMKRILSLATAAGYLEKNTLTPYRTTAKIKELETVDQELSAFTDQFEQIARAFRKFAKTTGAANAYSTEQAKAQVIQYIDSLKPQRINGHIHGFSGGRAIDSLFSRFVYYLADEKHLLFNALTKMVTGSILKDYITYDAEPDCAYPLKNLTDLITADIAFLLLGIDITKDRKQYYLYKSFLTGTNPLKLY